MKDNITLNLEEFGNIIDKFLKDNPIQMIVEMPEGTIEPTVVTNSNLGPVVEFYILLQATKTVFGHFRDILKEDMEEDFIDKLFEMLKTEILEGGEQSE